LIQKEIKEGARFEFGKNWERFISCLNEERIKIAEKSLCNMLMCDDLKGKSFIDVGCGSGLFSLAAVRLEAEYVYSFDYDPQSVSCCLKLKNLFFSNISRWMIEEGSVLDEDYLKSLGTFDVVYSWGVLHHTGAMWRALENVSLLVKNGGKLYISIYNDQGKISQVWRAVKIAYNKLPTGFKFLILWPAFVGFWGLTMIKDILRGKPFYTWRNYSRKSTRGMSFYYDVIDWIGGFPFEVAKPEEIFNFYRNKGYILEKLKTCGGKIGCNEFVFTLSNQNK